jgi:type I restriction enzyme R subunit
VHFELFDPEVPVAVSRHHLPHWFQPGVTYFVTFRTADSLPRAVVERWLQDRDRWLIAHGVRPDNPDWRAKLQLLTLDEREEYHREFSDAFHKYLDAGYGECLLRRPEIAETVAEAVRHFDGERYVIADFVVMPNHVHVLLGLLSETALRDVCYSWKKFTATRINRITRRVGHFWQAENFDHLVRTPEQFGYIREYIAKNPVRAGLKAGEYTHYSADLDADPR